MFLPRDLNLAVVPKMHFPPDARSEWPLLKVG